MLTVRVGHGEAPIRHVCGRVGVREELGEGPNREQEEGDGREREDDLDYLERNLGVPVVPKGVAEDELGIPHGVQALLDRLGALGLVPIESRDGEVHVRIRESIRESIRVEGCSESRDRPVVLRVFVVPILVSASSPVVLLDRR